MAVVDNVVLALDRGKNRLSIDRDVNRWLVLAEESQTDFVKTRFYCQKGCSVVFKDKVFRARVGTLALPQNLAHLVLDCAALPLPAG